MFPGQGALRSINPSAFLDRAHRQMRYQQCHAGDDSSWVAFAALLLYARSYLGSMSRCKRQMGHKKGLKGKGSEEGYWQR